jgi:hypothetical protein
LRAAQGRRTLLLEIALDFIVRESGSPQEPHSIRLLAYKYYLSDTDEREILAYHWHPSGESRVVDPHMHLSNRLNPIEMGRNQDPLRLADLHLLTGFVTLEDVVRLLIEEFGVRPRLAEWDALLRANRATAHAEQLR